MDSLRLNFDDSGAPLGLVHEGLSKVCLASRSLEGGQFSFFKSQPLVYCLRADGAQREKRAPSISEGRD